MFWRKFYFLPAKLSGGNALIFLWLSAICVFSQTVHSQNIETSKFTDPLTLEPGKPIERELADQQKHNYQIKLSAARYAKIIVEQRGVDVVARLQSADGKIISDNNSDPRNSGRETIECTTKEESVLTISVWAKQNNAATGRYEISLAESRPANDNDYALDNARQLNFQADALWRAGKYNEATPLAQRALEIRETEAGADSLDFAASLITLGNIVGDNGDYAASESLYLRALVIREKLLGKDDIAVSTILNNLGLLYKEKGDYAAAESALRRTLEIRGKNLEPNHLLIANALNNLATVSAKRGDKAKAAELFRRALEIREKVLPPNSPDIAQSLVNLADPYGDFAAAEPLYLRALAIREKAFGAESPYVAETLYSMALLYRNAGDNKKAAIDADRALTIYEKSYGENNFRTGYALGLLAIIYRDSGDYEQSAAMFRRTIEINEKIQGVNHPDLSNFYSNFADLYVLKGETEKALSMEIRADEILEFNVELNLKTGSEQQKFDYLKTLDQFVSHTVGLNFQYAPNSQQAANLGAEIVLRQKGRVLDAMADNIGALRRRFNAQDQLLLNDLDRINRQIAEFVLRGIGGKTAAEYQAKIKTLTAERDKLEDQISRRAAGFFEKTKTVALSDVQSLIPADAALLEFTLYDLISKKPALGKAKPPAEPHYAVYILRNREAVKGFDLGSAARINEAIAAYRQALRNPKRSDAPKLARVVYDKIVQPLRPILKDAKQLLISPDGELNLIPFEALVDGQNQYLIENYAFTYLTSGRDLLRMQTARQSKNTLLLIANPQFGASTVGQTTTAGKTGKSSAAKRQTAAARSLSDTYFAPLSGTIAEARSIQNLFPGALVLTGGEATETALKQASAPKILHIATHGFFLEDKISQNNQATRNAQENVEAENPLLRSGLALAGANRRAANSGDDGILTALEASGLNLWGTKLVVLSACDTGLGEVKNGEGVYGLRRSFVLSGAESLVMSLWSISDFSTRQLMTNYYKNLKNGIGRGAALRQVQLEMIKKKGREHPFYWASFIQSGEWANLDGKR